MVTEEEMDRWLAAHYGMSFENVPQLKPNSMPKVLYEKIKKYAVTKKGSNNESGIKKKLIKT